MCISSTDAIVTRCQVVRNAGMGLLLAEECDFSLVCENAIDGNAVGVEFRGKRATVGWNTFRNTRQVRTGGKDNLLISNSGLRFEDLEGTGVAWFNPPTTSNPHREALIWKGAGQKDTPMGRHDLLIASGAEPMDVKEASARLLTARQEHPGKVLVATLKGHFEVRSKDGLAVPDHTCVLLNGEIINQPCDEPRDQLVSLKGKGCASFSGGAISSTSRVLDAISAQAANNAVLVDGVRINLNAENSRAGTKSRNAVSPNADNARIRRAPSLRFGPNISRCCANTSFTNEPAVWCPR